MTNPIKQNESDSFKEIATVRIELQDNDSLIRRQVEVPTSITLKVLHDIIQVVMGWIIRSSWAGSITFRGSSQSASKGMAYRWMTTGEPSLAPTRGKVRLRDVKSRKTRSITWPDFGMAGSIASQ
jgi:hypothetical protein